MPAKNEAEGMNGILKTLAPFASTIIVVDGHSTDRTMEIARMAGAVCISDHGIGRGKAVRLGLDLVKTEIAVVVDADGSTDVFDIPALIFPILQGRADMVIGSRRTGGSLDLRLDFDGLLRLFGSDLLTFLINFHFHTRLTDAIYSFRAVRTSILPSLRLRADGHAIEQEMVVSCLKKGYTVLEIPSREKARAWGVSKLDTLTGIKLLGALLVQLYGGRGGKK